LTRPVADLQDPRLAKALAHPVRVRLLGILQTRQASPSEMAEELGMPLTNVSYHVRVLADYGLIRLVSRTPRRGVIEHHYVAVDRRALAAEIWARLPDVAKSEMAGASLVDLSEFVGEGVKGDGFAASAARANALRLTLDQKGWEKLAGELDRLVDLARRIEGESERRLRTAGRSGEPAGLVALLFGVPAQDGSDRRRGRGGRRRRTARPKGASV